jgi:hypothetical protein
VLVRLHNDGPGIALDVRWSLEFFDERDTAEDERHSKELTRRLASEPIRGLRPGESWPSAEGYRPQVSIPQERAGHTWFIAVRFTDSGGTRWEYAEPWDVGTLADPVQRLRRVRLAWVPPRWWWSRIRSGGSPRGWFAYTDAADW